MKINARTSLRYKQIYVLAIGLMISFGMYLFTQSMGNYLISLNHLNTESVGSRLETYQDSIENYIKKNKLSVKDVRALSKWIKSHKYTYITIYSGDEIIYESGFWNESYYSYETAEIFLEDTQQLTRDIEFTDGIYSVSIIDFSEIKWYNLVFYVSLGVFLLFLFGIVIYYNHRIIARIMLLSKEVSLIEQGNLEQPIYHKGSDEIALLAMNADNMRNSIITRYKSEKEAWEANSELITSMSHDIRTPLTALIGYLEILETKGYHSEDQLYKYIKSCKDKSLQLKELSDKLFQYFLVFGKETILMKKETFDARILLEQLISEHVFDLSNQGFDVRTGLLEQSCMMTADIQYFKRLFDNLFSNVRKYANTSGPVVVNASCDGNRLIISISNDNRQDDKLAESTGIGLKTCRKITEQMNGTFKIRKNRTRFEARASFPVAAPRKE
jgi:signal transduction histidine kinase